MQQRRTLGLRPVVEPDLAGDPVALFRHAIARRRCVVATYNRTRVTLAPHVVYLRHDAPIVDAVVVERDGEAPREVKLGAFRLSGLSELSLTSTPFTPNPAVFDPAAPRYAEAVLQMVQERRLPGAAPAMARAATEDCRVG